MKNIKVIVVFRKEKDGEIFALFPKIKATVDGKSCLCYVHTGQHGSADYQYCIDKTCRANPSEYYDLAEELKGIGYILDIRQGKRTSRG